MEYLLGMHTGFKFVGASIHIRINTFKVRNPWKSSYSFISYLRKKITGMNSWSDQLLNVIDSKLQGANEKDLRFFRIAEFKRNIHRVDEFSSSCPGCKKEQIHIADVVKDIQEAIEHPGKKRREYDRMISRLSKHIQKEHGFYPPYYFTYLISFMGIVAGSVLGYFLMQLNAGLKLELFSAGFAIGLLPTYVWGHLKDKKIREEKKLM